MGDPAFPEAYASGHFVLIGGTGTGKTYYAKYILKGRRAAVPGLRIFIYTPPVSAHDWLIPEEDGRPLVGPEAVRSEWSKEGVAAMYEELRAAKAEGSGGVIVFDDFKSQLDYHTNKEFLELWRVLRHLNTQVLAIGHAPNDVPPVVRQNVTHCILTFTRNRDAIKALAQTYLGGDIGRLEAALKELAPRSVLWINARTNELAPHRAAGVRTSGVGLAGAGGPGAGGPAGGGAGAGAGALGLAVGGPSVSGASVALQGRGDVAVKGVYQDHSTTNQFLRLEENLVAQQRASALALQDIRARAEVGRKLELEGVAHGRRLRELQENGEVLGLLHKAFLSAEERGRVAAVLSQRLGDAGLTGLNFRARGADRAFMEAFFPERPYAPPPLALTEGALIVPSLVKGDLRGLAGDLALGACCGDDFGAGLLGFASRAARGLGRSLAGLAGLPAPAAAPSPAPSPPGRPALRAELRRLSLAHLGGSLSEDERALLLGHFARTYRKGLVSADRLTALSLEFLHEHFRADFAEVAARAAGRRPRPPAEKTPLARLKEGPLTPF